MPAGTKVAKAEAALKRGASKKGVRDKGAYVFGTLNKMGLMHGNKATARGLKKATPVKHSLMRR